MYFCAYVHKFEFEVLLIAYAGPDILVTMSMGCIAIERMHLRAVLSAS